MQQYRGADLASLIAGRRVTTRGPRWVEHPYGATVVPEQPRRVVSIGLDEHELLLHLGIVPVLVRDDWGGQPNGVWPWARHKLGVARPATFSGPVVVPVDLLREVQPDLIVATWVELDRAAYDELAAIAPTIPNASPADPWAQPWDLHLLDLAAAFGLRAYALRLIDGVRARLMSIAEAHPHWRDLAAASVTVQDDQLHLDLHHRRSSLLAALGFRAPEEARRIPGRSTEVAIDQLDRDVLIWSNGADDAGPIASWPGRTELAVHRDRREVYLDKTLTAAFSLQSPLSLHHLLDHLVPELEATLDGRARTAPSLARRYGLTPG